MKDKIFLKLKQVYSHLGLGDSILQAHAEALNGIGFVNDENIELVINSQKGFLESLQRENDKRANEASIKARMNAEKEYKKQAEETHIEDSVYPEWFKAEKAKTDKLIKTLQDNLVVLKDKNEQYEREKVALERKNLITAKAQSLGIPKYRIEEGFAISDDADEATISEYLTQVSNNIKTQQLPSNKNVFPLAGDKPDKTVADEIAKSLVG